MAAVARRVHTSDDGIREIPIEYVDHPRFHDVDAEQFVESLEQRAAQEGDAKRKAGSAGVSLPGHLRALCARPLLTPDEERARFLRMNYERSRANRLREEHRDAPSDAAAQAAFERHLARAERVRNEIVEANTRLVIALARKFVSPTLSFDALMSAGFLPLMRAVDLFDVSRGNRFSTYATWAVRNHMLRMRGRDQKRLSRFPSADEQALDAICEQQDAVDDEEERVVDDVPVEGLLARLGERDRTIVAARFGLDAFDRAHTYAEIGEMIGLSKERVRQLNLAALDHLREECRLPE